MYVCAVPAWNCAGDAVCGKVWGWEAVGLDLMYVDLYVCMLYIRIMKSVFTTGCVGRCLGEYIRRKVTVDEIIV